MADSARQLPEKLQDQTARDDHSRHLFIAWIILCCLVGGMVLIYLSVGLQASGGSTPVMPLDDTYIHFQYARALAEGHPFQYNPGQPPTSGATSLLYPVVLAIGYRLGSQAERLAWWALAIGALCWLGSAWLVYRTGNSSIPDSNVSHWIALAVAVAFVLTGSLGWAFMSGMETGLMLLATLLTLWYVVRDVRRGVVIAGTLATLVRPEGLAIGLLAALYMASHERSRRDRLRHLPLYALPLIAGAVQPLINLFVTGSLTASGMQAKSYLYQVPSDPGLILKSVAGAAVSIWSQMLTGLDPDGVRYLAPGFLLLGLLAMLFNARRAWRIRRLNPAILVVGWLLALTLAISILETAFWQFKRYQQPMIALLFPLAAWTLIWLWCLRPRSVGLTVVPAVLIALIGVSGITSLEFSQHYAGNVHEVAASQMPMAHFVASTLPPDAIVGVHDIGAVRYLGNHTTYDVIGLTMPGAARAWRNGPGAAYEQMLHSPWRPDYFAIYKDALGLSYFAGTGLYSNTLASFPSTNPVRNVASATSGGQAVYKADWTYAQFAGQPWQPPSLKAIDGMALVDSVNVADLASEDAHQYRWWQAAQRPGFASEVYEQTYVACQPAPNNPSCKVLDGGRLITGGEEMTVATRPGQDLIWITRVHPRNEATLGIFVDGKWVATRVIPAIPGQWLEIATLVPGNMITGTQTRVRAEADITDPTVGHYMPYYHWFYQGRYHADTAITRPGPTATFGQSIMLVGRALAYNPDTRTIQLDLEWQARNDAGSLGDAKLFIHLYDQNDKLVEGAQIDQRPGNGVLPPANWLPGTVRDSYTLNVPASAPAGTYRVAIGLYDPEVPDVRLPVSGEGAGSDRRLFIGTVEVR